MIPWVLAALVITMAIMMALYWRMTRSPRTSPWANVIVCIVLGWSATGVLAAGNQGLANDLAILTYFTIGITILLALLGPHHHTKNSSVCSGTEGAKTPVEKIVVGPDEE